MRIPSIQAAPLRPATASMRVIDLQAFSTAPILDYQSAAAASALIGHGTGNSHIHWLRFEPGGIVGPHPAGVGQLLIPFEGRGWAAGPDGTRQPISPGQVAFFAPGEVHSKGSEAGMSAFMIQVSTLVLEPR